MQLSFGGKVTTIQWQLDKITFLTFNTPVFFCRRRELTESPWRRTRLRMPRKEKRACIPQCRLIPNSSSPRRGATTPNSRPALPDTTRLRLSPLISSRWARHLRRWWWRQVRRSSRMSVTSSWHASSPGCAAASVGSSLSFLQVSGHQSWSSIVGRAAASSNYSLAAALIIGWTEGYTPSFFEVEGATEMFCPPQLLAVRVLMQLIIKTISLLWKWVTNEARKWSLLFP